MSRTTSRAYRNTELLTNSGCSAYATKDDRADSKEQERLAELILKAANLWQSEADPELASYQEKVATEFQDPEVELDEVSKQILRTLRTLGQARPCDLSKYCAVSQPTIQRRLKELLLASLIAKHGNTKGVSYALPKTEK